MPEIRIGKYSSEEEPFHGHYSQVYKGKNDVGGVVAIKQVIVSEKERVGGKWEQFKEFVEGFKKDVGKQIEGHLKLMDIEEDGKDVFIVTEFCEETFESFLQMNAPFSEEKALNFFKQLVTIVANKKNIQPRDIYPENLMISGNKIKSPSVVVSHFFGDLSNPSPYGDPEGDTGPTAVALTLGLLLFKMLVGSLPNKAPGWESDIDDYVSKNTKEMMLGLIESDAGKRTTVQQISKKLGFGGSDGQANNHQQNNNSGHKSGSEGAGAESLLLKFDEATIEIKLLTERIKLLEEENAEKDINYQFLVDKHEKDLVDLRHKADEEVQMVRQELGDTLDQILKGDAQYDELERRKRQEVEHCMMQLEQAHEALESLTRTSTEEILNLQRTLEELKDAYERKCEEINDMKKESEMIDGFRNEELVGLRKELDDLTELFVNLESDKTREISELKAELETRGSAPAYTADTNGTKEAPRPAYTPSTPSTTTTTTPASASTTTTAAKPSTTYTPKTPTWQSRAATASLPSSSSTPSSTSSAPKPASWSSTPKPATTTTTTTPSTISSTPASKPSWSSTPKPTTSTPPPSTTTTTPTPAAVSKPSWTPPKPTISTTPAAKTTPTWSSAKKTPSVPPSPSGTPTGTPGGSKSSSKNPSPVPSPMVNVDLGDIPTFTAEEVRGFLKDNKYPIDGFNKAQAELYVMDSDFAKIFGMAKAEWMKLPKWKQDPIRKKNKFF